MKCRSFAGTTAPDPLVSDYSLPEHWKPPEDETTSVSWTLAALQPRLQKCLDFGSYIPPRVFTFELSPPQISPAHQVALKDTLRSLTRFPSRGTGLLLSNAFRTEERRMPL